MSKVLLDNWTLINSFIQLVNNKNYAHNTLRLSMSNLLMGIILWDDINFPPDVPLSLCFKEMQNDETTRQLLTLCKPLDLPKFEMIKPYLSPSTDEDAWLAFYNANSDKLNKRSSMYFDMSIEHKVNYFPHPERSRYLQETQAIGKRLKPDRSKALFPIEKRLQEFYDEIDDICGGSGYFTCPAPLLHDYIKVNAESPLDQLHVALGLRHNENVIKFRKSLNDMDELLNEGRRADYFRVMKQIDELSKEIVNAHTGKLAGDTFKVKYTFPLKFEASKEFEIKIPSLGGSKAEKNLHLTFLADLLEFGLNGRT
ncbi:MAG: hypothetical protein FWF81_00880 [Defluviitaleaceae bacterium]|nr:hypothetical protein [Defluviitaleaceae bacterium]